MTKAIDKITIQLTNQLIQAENDYIKDELKRLTNLGVLWIEKTPTMCSYDDNILKVTENFRLVFNGHNELIELKNKISNVKQVLLDYKHHNVDVNIDYILDLLQDSKND